MTNNPDAFVRLRSTTKRLREELLTHPMYAEVNSRDRLRRFMELHVYAVWDFMSLAKRLQHEFTCTEVPWVPPAHPEPARFMNEVVLGEESDVDLEGRPASHLEMYLFAMDEIGANRGPFDAFLLAVREVGAEDAFGMLEAPEAVRQFARRTLAVARFGAPVEVASYFFFGREDVIPEMFERLLGLWEGGTQEVPNFAYYLKRHIELDSESHGPLAEKLLKIIAGDDDPTSWSLATRSAEEAIRQRLRLWDCIRDQILVLS